MRKPVDGMVKLILAAVLMIAGPMANRLCLAAALNDTGLAPSVVTNFQIATERLCWTGRQPSQNTVAELSRLEEACASVRLQDIATVMTLSGIATTGPFAATAPGATPATGKSAEDNSDSLPGVFVPVLVGFASTLPATTRFANAEEAATRYSATRVLATSPATRLMSIAGPLDHALYYGELHEQGRSFASVTQPHIQPELLKAVSFMRSVATSNTSAPAAELVRRMADSIGGRTPATQRSDGDAPIADAIDTLAHQLAQHLAAPRPQDADAPPVATNKTTQNISQLQPRNAVSSQFHRVGPLNPQDIVPRGPDRQFLARYLLSPQNADDSASDGPTIASSLPDPGPWICSVLGLRSSQQFVRDWIDGNCHSAEPVASGAICAQSVAGATFIPPQQISQQR